MVQQEYKECEATSRKYKGDGPDFVTNTSANEVQGSDHCTNPCHTSDFSVESTGAYEYNVAGVSTDNYPVDDYTYADTTDYIYIESNSDDGDKVSDCCIQIRHYYGFYAYYLALQNYTYISTSTYNSNVPYDKIIISRQFYDLYKYPTYDKNPDSDVLVETE